MRKKRILGFGGWAIGGGIMMGIGVGFFFLHRSPLYFVGCIMCGLGFGLILEAILTVSAKEVVADSNDP